MSEANEVTEIVERVREHLAAAVGIGHPDEKGYIDFLTEILAALTAATERAEAAEAEWSKAQYLLDSVDCSAREGLGLLHCRHDAKCTVCSLRAERDALRKAVDAVRATRTEPQTRTGDNDDWVDGFQYGYAAALETVNDALDAALAVQPTTGEGDE